VSEHDEFIPVNNLARAIARDFDQVVLATKKVLASGYLVQGPEHDQFEVELAAYLGVDFALGVGSGTDALELAIKSSMPPGRHTVITAANAGGYTTTAALRGGFRVAFADVDDESLCIDAATVVSAITPDVGVVVITHLYGNLTDLRELLDLCREHGIRLVEDCAQAIGARRNEVSAGAFGAISAMSFYPTKNLGAMGDGGAVVTNDASLAARVRALRQYGWTKKYHVSISGGMNSRLDELQAAVLRLRLPLLDSLNARRRLIVSRYEEAAASLPASLIRVMPASGAHHVAHLAVARSTNRESVRAQLLTDGIRTDVQFPVPDHAQESPTWRAVAVLPVTTAASDEVFSLPCFPELRDDEVDRVCGAIANLK
jgi:dTDP-4-amino-4,6-dideoxygalactose transaminase